MQRKLLREQRRGDGLCLVRAPVAIHVDVAIVGATDMASEEILLP